VKLRTVVVTIKDPAARKSAAPQVRPVQCRASSPLGPKTALVGHPGLVEASGVQQCRCGSTVNATAPATFHMAATWTGVATAARGSRRPGLCEHTRHYVGRRCKALLMATRQLMEPRRVWGMSQGQRPTCVFPINLAVGGFLCEEISVAI
jgi:hypothetical protein